MKKIILCISVIFVLVFLSACSLESRLNTFSSKIVSTNYGVFWSGYIVYEEDSLKFNILGDVSYRLDDSASDIISIETNDGKIFKAKRFIKDPINRPKVGKVKAMDSWLIFGNRLIFSKNLKQITGNGKIFFNKLPEDKKLATNRVIYLYDLNNDEAEFFIIKANNLFN